jgi:hypothetical protein
VTVPTDTPTPTPMLTAIALLITVFHGGTPYNLPAVPISGISKMRRV